MTIIKKQDGGILISDIINGHLINRMYYGYTKREAAKLFKEAARSQQ